MMPRFSDWLEHEVVLACVYPYREQDLESLVSQGISHLINLHTRPHDASMLARHGIQELHLPVVDFSPPSPEQLDQGIATLEVLVGEGRRVAVHCAAGLGRTGTLLACYLVRQGLSADDAIARVRAARPGSVESDDQIAAVHEYALRER